MNKREFLVDTPVGQLRIYAKHDVDCAKDFPGVFIDFVHKDEDGSSDDIVLTCVEYDSVCKGIYTHVYGDAVDDAPTDSIRHTGLTEGDN
ncbi:MAG: hypothetical protein RR415_10490 [Ruthenibacterium sp.]